MCGYFEFGSSIQERRCLNIFASFKLWWPFCSIEQSGVSLFGRGSYEEHLREISIHLGQQLRWRSRLKIYSIFSYDGHFVRQSVTLWVCFESFIRGIWVKLF